MTTVGTSLMVALGELGTIVTGRTPPSEKQGYFGNACPFITPTDMVGQKNIWETERYLSAEGRALLARCIVPARSVTVSCIGWQMGKAAVTTRESATNQQLNTIVPNARVDPDFLYYSLCTRREELKRLGSVGTRTPIVNKSEFSALKVLLPPLPVQHRIADTLSAYDDLIHNCELRIRVLDEMARALYREWFVNFRYPGHEKVPLVDSPLGSIPNGWPVQKLGEVIQLHYGKALKQENRRGGAIPVFASSGVVGWHDERLAEGPGIVLGRKGNVGSVFWSDTDFFVIDTAYFITATLPLRFVYFDIQSKNFINGDAAVPGLSRQQAYGLETLVPPRDLLGRFCDLAESFLNPASVLRRQVENLRKTRDLLLPRLLSGQLSVDADVESAA